MLEAVTIDDFLAEAGWPSAVRTPLVGDASRRRYERVVAGDRNAVLMICPPSLDDTLPRFIEVTQALRKANLSAPEIYAADTVAGLALLEDLGDALYARLAETEPDGLAERLAAAAEVTAKVGAIGIDAPEPSTADLLDALSPTRRWLPDVDAAAFEDLSSLLAHQLDYLATAPRALSLRDYHGGNLLWLGERGGLARVGLLDYQDAFRVHPSYDLVSLLTDVRQSYPPDIVTATTDRFAEITGADTEHLSHAFATLTVQRNTRILGIFCRLALRDGKAGYLDHLPATWTSVRQALNHPDLATLAPVFARAIPEPTSAWLGELRARCQ